MKDFGSILKLLKEASPVDVFIISFVALPFVLNAWLTILKELGCQAKLLVILLVIVAYFVGIVGMVVGTTKEKKRELAKDQIMTYLQSKDFVMMSFDRVREKLNSSYTDLFLNSVIEAYPNDLRQARLKGSKRGVAIVAVETDKKEEA
jgi:hypothetical protein